MEVSTILQPKVVDLIVLGREGQNLKQLQTLIKVMHQGDSSSHATYVVLGSLMY
jgi:predicted RNA-binding protein Jag